MIVYPSWPCNYPEPKIKEDSISSKINKTFSSLDNINITDSINKFLTQDLNQNTFDSLLESLFKSFSKKLDQPTLFDDLVDQTDSSVIPDDLNPFLDMYHNLCEMKVPVSQGVYITSKALVHQDIVNSHYPEGIQFPININLFEKKFNIPVGKISSLEICKKIDDSYYEITMEKVVDINQIIF